jgi:hypothetical protein
MSATETPQRRRGFSLFGLLLVALGVVLLLNTTGALPFSIWPELFSYWPVLLVLIGLKIILAPRAPLISAGLIVLAMVGTVTAAYFSIPEHEYDEPGRVTYVEPLADTEILHLGMGFVGGKVELMSDPGGGSSSPRLFAADFNNHPARVIHDRIGRSTRIYLSTDGPVVRFSNDDGYAQDSPGPDAYEREHGFYLGGLVDWRLMISPDVAVELEINAGAADLDLDLQDLNVRRLIVGSGASDIRILLPATAGQTHVEIASGATDVEIVVPEGVAARIANEIFLSSTQIDSARFPHTDDGHQSPDYYYAENRVSIEIDAVAADITIS